MSTPRPKWPAEELELWRRPGHQLDNFDERAPTVEDGLDAEELFKKKITELLETQIDAFIGERCSERGVGSPDLRRLARVALSHTLAQCANDLIVKNSAICREHGLPWTALAEVTQSTGITGFQRRWGDQVEEAITQRVTDRDQHGALDGDANYVPPAKRRTNDQ
ncbi:MAG: hypothetical protein HKL85_13440 [Acidimicrobiaceae bacterium]|nr:hypothetical protein [Acidimicrobiaceae bacterium]